MVQATNCFSLQLTLVIFTFMQTRSSFCLSLELGLVTFPLPLHVARSYSPFLAQLINQVHSCWISVEEMGKEEGEGERKGEGKVKGKGREKSKDQVVWNSRRVRSDVPIMCTGKFSIFFSVAEPAGSTYWDLMFTYLGWWGLVCPALPRGVRVLSAQPPSATHYRSVHPNVKNGDTFL